MGSHPQISRVLPESNQSKGSLGLVGEISHDILSPAELKMSQTSFFLGRESELQKKKNGK